MKRLSSLIKLALLLIGLIIFGSTAGSTTANLIVQTTDDAGMPLPSVSLVLKSLNIDCFNADKYVRIWEMMSDNKGILRFDLISPGIYVIEASRSGFLSSQPQHISLEERSVVFVKIVLLPKLPSIQKTSQPQTTTRCRSFPVISPGQICVQNGSQSQTIPELIENVPGILLDPETGLPRFPSQRTSDVGLFIDGIPLQDPADQRPGFFPPKSMVESVKILKAGQSIDQQSSTGGAIYLRTQKNCSKPFSGMFGVTDIVASSSFLNDPAAQDCFDYWQSISDFSSTKGTTLTDRRYNLLLRGNTGNLNLMAGVDWRFSNRGFSSDYVNDNSLKDVNAWSKTSFEWGETGNASLVTGYQKTALSIENQWKMRGYPPVASDSEKLFGAFQFRQNFFSTYWYQCELSAFSTHSSLESDKNVSNYPQSYPYDLGHWFADSRRSTYRLRLKSGNTTDFHAIEAGVALNLMKINVNEGFDEPFSEKKKQYVNYEWIADISDHEFSVWGSDRWFISDNLELGFAMRWDRFNYLDQTDFLSPKIFMVWSWASNQLTAGVERIVQSPGLGFISDEVRLPDSAEWMEEDLEPQLGFRWYGGYNRSFGRFLRFDLSGQYSFLSKMLFMLPLETEPGIEFNIPATGETGKSVGVFFNAVWSIPIADTEVSLGYGFNRSRISWGEDINLTHVRPFPEMPWRRVYYTGKLSSSVPMDNDLTHSIQLSAKTVVPVCNVDIGVDYRYSTAYAYTPLGAEGYPVDLANVIHSRHGKPVQRVDIDCQRLFQVSPHFHIRASLSAINVFNTYQFPAINPYTGDSVVDPYRMDHNQPRTVRAGLFFHF